MQTSQSLGRLLATPASKPAIQSLPKSFLTLPSQLGKMNSNYLLSRIFTSTTVEKLASPLVWHYQAFPVPPQLSQVPRYCMRFPSRAVVHFQFHPLPPHGSHVGVSFGITPLSFVCAFRASLSRLVLPKCRGHRLSHPDYLGSRHS